MKKIIIGFLILLIPVISNAGDNKSDLTQNNTADIYNSLNLGQVGLKKEVFEKALKGWKKLHSKLANSDILSIADYSQSSNNKRLYIIDFKNQKLLFNTYIAHGKNTGEEFAQSFSNEPSSLKSSMGFYITSNTFISPKHGLALLISGVEKGFNDNAQKREIIIHAADYVSEDFIKKHGRLGRSFGCPALSPELNKPIIETIKAGTCLFIYYPSEEYNRNSVLLN